MKECDSEIRNIEAKQQEMDETKKTLKEEHDRTMDEFNKKRVKVNYFHLLTFESWGVDVLMLVLSKFLRR